MMQNCDYPQLAVPAVIWIIPISPSVPILICIIPVLMHNCAYPNLSVIILPWIIPVPACSYSSLHYSSNDVVLCLWSCVCSHSDLNHFSFFLFAFWSVLFRLSCRAPLIPIRLYPLWFESFWLFDFFPFWFELFYYASVPITLESFQCFHMFPFWFEVFQYASVPIPIWIILLLCTHYDLNHSSIFICFHSDLNYSSMHLFPF